MAKPAYRSSGGGGRVGERHTRAGRGRRTWERRSSGASVRTGLSGCVGETPQPVPPRGLGASRLYGRRGGCSRRDRNVWTVIFRAFRLLRAYRGPNATPPRETPDEA
jgi:hypothetical protein